MRSSRLCTSILVLFLTGCGADASLPPLWDIKGTDISNSAAFKFEADAGQILALVDHNSRPVSLDTFKGKHVVLFFGYTHCPDVCPTTLSDMAQAIELLGPEQAGKVQVLFVTVDPQRDTPEILKTYVPYFNPGFLGLHGTPEQIAKAAREFKIVYRKQVEPGASDYLIDHSAGSYVLDTQGRMRIYLPFATPPADIAHDLAVLMKAV